MNSFSVPTGYGINFSYPLVGVPKGLPEGEIADSGELFVWWEACNFDHLSYSDCRIKFRNLASHELGHFRQWQKLSASGNLHKWRMLDTTNVAKSKFSKRSNMPRCQVGCLMPIMTSASRS